MANPTQTGRPLEECGLPEQLVANLQAGGYATAEQVLDAPDEDLDRIPGVGEATIRTLRASLGRSPETGEPPQARDDGTVPGVQYPAVDQTRVSAAGDLLAQARALDAELARQRAQAGATLPDVRLDYAGSGYHFLRNGIPVDHEGKAIQPRGAYLAGMEAK